MKISTLKNFNIIVYGLLLAGSLNWGVLGSDPTEGFFSPTIFIGRLVFMLVGLAAIYDTLDLDSNSKRWGVDLQSSVSI